MAKPTHTLIAAVPIATGTCGWTGADVAPGDTLQTTDAEVYARLLDLGYGRAPGGLANGAEPTAGVGAPDDAPDTDTDAPAPALPAPAPAPADGA